MEFKRVLAIETSCDDTSVALVEASGRVNAVCSANQDLAHRPYGGVVPEIAGRNHTLNILPLVETCFEKAGMGWGDVQGIAVTNRPGLVGSLLVGLVTAKTLAFEKKLPFIGVNHLEGHLLAPFLIDDQYEAPKNFTYPYLALAVSGGHTHLYNVESLGVYKVLGQTIDDAAGEAFDKFAKMLGLGFPGGVQVDRRGKKGNPKAFSFPRPMIKEDNFLFSFSGLKTAAQRTIEALSEDERRDRADDLCASYQEAIVDVLLAKLDRAVDHTGLKRAILTGGVSANSRLRESAEVWGREKGVEVVVPPLRYCTDNAAMIGIAGVYRLNRGEFSKQDLGPSPRVWPEDFIVEDKLVSRR